MQKIVIYEFFEKFTCYKKKFINKTKLKINYIIIIILSKLL